MDMGPHDLEPNLEPSDRLIAALEGIGVLGEWSFDYASQVFRSSPAVSHAFAVDAEAGERGHPVEVYERAVHPDDVGWLRSTRAATPGWSGLRVTEMRVIGADGRERWIMVRGRFVVDEDDRLVLGYGVMLDLTDYNESGERPLVTPAAPLAHPVIVLLDALSTAYRAARQIALDAVVRSCRAMLFQAARHLARQNATFIARDRSGGDRKRLH